MSATFQRLQGKCARTAVFVLIAAAAFAQSNVGEISGQITDSSGASIAACSVTAVNPLTGARRTVTTQESGVYIFAGLPEGTWNIRAEKDGFRSSEQTGVLLDAASRRSVDFRMDVGTMSESVQVSAAIEQVQTASGDVTRVIGGRQLSQIALNGRNYSQLLRLIPGAVATTLDPFNLALSTTGQRINGIRTDSIVYNLDGAENMDNGGNSNAAVNPSADAIAEVKILTSGYSAEFGGRSGAIVNVVTKSGTRDFHGTLFEFVRNDRFDARTFFARQVDPLRFNDFGYTVGGPAFIPKHFNQQKDKLFFFISQEWKFSHTGVTRLTNVPTVAERAGDFRASSLTAPVDPLTNTPFPARIVPASRFSANGPKLLRPIPLPNFAGTGGNYSATGVSKTDPKELLMRFDYQISQNTQLNYRWVHDDWDIIDAFQGGSLGIVPGGRPRPAYITSLGFSHIFSPTVMNHFNFSLSHDIIVGLPQNEILSRSSLGFTAPELLTGNRFGIVPDVSIAGFAGYTGGDRIKKNNSIFMWRDDFSVVKGSHSLKVGVHITRSRTDENIRFNDQGAVTFAPTARNTTRNVLADVLLGNFQNYTESGADADFWGRFNQVDAYFQDNWKLSRRLTLEMGVRYNYIPPFYNQLGNTSTFLPERFDPAKAPGISPADGSKTPATGDPYNGIVLFGSAFPQKAIGRVPAASDPSLNRLFAGLSRGAYDRNLRDIGPRFGFAYDPFGKGNTSVRGGFGMFYDRIPTNVLINPSGNPPFNVTSSIFDGNIDNPAGGTARAFPSNLTMLPRQLKSPSVISYNFGVQQQLPRQVILDVGYVGNLGRHIPRTININQLPVATRLNAPNSGININALRRFPGYANISQRDHGDNSSYNAMQVTASRRMNAGFSMTANYTWARALDTSSGTPLDAYNARPDYGLSSVHRAHLLNVNYIYDLPFFAKAANPILRHGLGGWELAGVTTYQSGAPNTFTALTDSARIGTASTRAEVIGNPVLPKSERTLARWFNTEAFLAPERMVAGRFGNSGRNVFMGPAFNQWDISVIKNFQLHERARLQFRAESFNVFNHPSFTSIDTTVRFDSAGRPAQTYGAVTGAGPARVLEFGMKLYF
ncbi:MAG: carboxypeptidase regulatory-like domain-containing protein [Bryobacteraceae bacterium]|nr:carboxypeptidase regulatory-like domain-containing protein [Bryobacteraceae bacterium]